MIFVDRILLPRRGFVVVCIPLGIRATTIHATCGSGRWIPVTLISPFRIALILIPAVELAFTCKNYQLKIPKFAPLITQKSAWSETEMLQMNLKQDTYLVNFLSHFLNGLALPPKNHGVLLSAAQLDPV